MFEETGENIFLSLNSHNPCELNVFLSSDLNTFHPTSKAKKNIFQFTID